MNSHSVIFLRKTLPLIFAVMLVLGLAACQNLSGWLDSQGGKGTATPVPLASDRFTLNSPDDDVVGRVQIVIARHEDTLPDIARRFNLGYEEIVAANPDVDPWLPGEGTRVVLPTQFILPDAPREGIVLNLATLRLFYFPESEPGEPATVYTHPIGIGRVGWSTPTGKTRIIRKDKDPTWYVPASIRQEHARQGKPLPAQVPPGPDNPLGNHVLRLDLPSYLIHGTNKPYGVGMRVSHGCVRLYPEDIQALYYQVPVETPVHIVNQPYLAGWHQGRLYLEIHAPLEDDKRNWDKRLQALLKNQTNKGASHRPIDWDRTVRLVDKPPGLPIPILTGDPDVSEILASAQVVENTIPWGANYTREFASSPNLAADLPP